jgi:hypothetical protein
MGDLLCYKIGFRVSVGGQIGSARCCRWGLLVLVSLPTDMRLLLTSCCIVGRRDTGFWAGTFFYGSFVFVYV